MNEEQRVALKNMLLQSLYDYHFTNNGASYHLPKVMVDTEPESKRAIETLIEEGLAQNNGQDNDESLILSITPKGIEEIKNNHHG